MPLGVSELTPPRAGPDDDVEAQGTEWWPDVDALDQAELVGGTEEAHEFAAGSGARAPEALAREVGLDAGPV